MLPILCFNIIASKEPLAVSKSFIPSKVLPHFHTRASIRLLGFEKKYAERLNYVLSKGDFSQIDIVNGAPEVHHLFSAEAKDLSIEITDKSNITKVVEEHFKKDTAQVAIYLIFSTECTARNSPLIGSGKGWIAIRFCKRYITGDDVQDVYIITDLINDILIEVLHHKLESEPHVSITDSDVDTILIDSEENIFANKTQKAIDSLKLASFTVTPIDYKPELFEPICQMCEDAVCAAYWLSRMSIFHASKSMNSLPIFIIPSKCPASFFYGDRDLVLARDGDLLGLAAGLMHSLFGVDIFDDSQPFQNILIQRNKAVYPLRKLSQRVINVIENVTDLLHLELDFTSQTTLNHLDSLVDEFSTGIHSFGEHFLDDDALDRFKLLENLTAAIETTWQQASGQVKSRRICAANSKDMSEPPSMLTRPIFYMIVALVATIALLTYAFTVMQPRKVVSIISNPSPLL